MKLKHVKLIAVNTWKQAFRSPATGMLTLVLLAVLLMATYVGWSNYVQQNDQRHKYQEIVRGKWLSQPDKHPHRMSHYGYLAFRPKHELSFFDFGIESFAGVSIFLESHKQNTVNLSEAGFSSGMLRFGEMSVSMVLQLLVPLLIFFLGYSSIAGEREMGTLKLLRTQGVSWKEILLGKVLGIGWITAVLYMPVFLITILLWAGLSDWSVSLDSSIRLLLLLAVYFMYFFICAVIAAVVSAFQKTSKGALVTLISIWIFFGIIMPKITQSVGTSLYPSPSKIAFDNLVHKDVAKVGDSHNPHDPYYNSIKDSVLRKYGVSNVLDLPFSYSGYIMMTGEKITSGIYTKHHEMLLETFRNQNKFTKWAGYLDPYMAIRNISMALTGADFENYAEFQKQTEKYRYMVTQRMNQLHMEKVINTNNVLDDRKVKVNKDEWKKVPAFSFDFKPVAWVMSNEVLAFCAMLSWFILSMLGMIWASKYIKTI